MPVGRGGQWYNDPVREAEAELASAARTATGTGTAFTVEDADSLLATLVLTAHAGTTPTLDVSLETTVDGTNWYTVGSFAQKTTVDGSEGKAFAPLGNSCRWKWTIAGTTPSYTFRIDVTARKDD